MPTSHPDGVCGEAKDKISRIRHYNFVYVALLSATPGPAPDLSVENKTVSNPRCAGHRSGTDHRSGTGSTAEWKGSKVKLSLSFFFFPPDTGREDEKRGKNRGNGKLQSLAAPLS
mgnify:CR=1 FL=1